MSGPLSPRRSRTGSWLSGLVLFLTAGAVATGTEGGPPEGRERRGQPPVEERHGQPPVQESGDRADDGPATPEDMWDLTLGTEPASADATGQIGVADEDYVPEVFQYRRRGDQPSQRGLSGEHRSAALTEFRVLDRDVEPGATVRAIARVEPDFERGRAFVAEFWSAEHGRAAVVYVNFRPHPKRKDLYLGRGRVGRHQASGRYDVGSTMITDEHGHKKAYSHEFNPVMRGEDGVPAYFVVADNPEADLTPPALREVRVLTPEVGEGGTIRAELLAEDDLSGAMQARAIWASPSGRRKVRSDFIGDGRTPGRFLAAFQIPEWYEGGRWSILQVELFDAARNSALLFAPTEPRLREAAVEVQADPARIDNEPPVLLAIGLPQPEALDTEAIPIAALVEDDRSGVDRVRVWFRSESGADLAPVDLESRNPPLNRPSLVPQPNVFRGSFRLEPWRERGRYVVSRVNLADRARNYRNLNAARDEAIQGLEVRFEPAGGAKSAKKPAERR